MSRKVKFISFFLILCMVMSAIAPVSNVKAASIKLNATSLKLKVGEGYSLHIDGKGGSTLWTSCKSSNPDVATVDMYGSVTAHMAGTATITLMYNDEKAQCKVTVENDAIQFTQKEITVYTGEEFTLTLKDTNTEYNFDLFSHYRSDGNPSGVGAFDYVYQKKQSGRAVFTASEAGTYYLHVNFTQNYPGETSAWASCKVNVLWKGLKANYASVAVGKTISLDIENAVLEKVEIGKSSVTELHELAVEARERALREVTEQYQAELDAHAKESAEKYIDKMARQAATKDADENVLPALEEQAKAETDGGSGGNFFKYSKRLNVLKEEVYKPYYETKYAEYYEQIKAESYQEQYDSDYNYHWKRKADKPARELYREYFGEENADNNYYIYEEETYLQQYREWLHSFSYAIGIDNYVEGKVKITDDNRIKGVEPGFVVLKVSYASDNVTQTAEVLVNITNTVCEGITETELELGAEYYPILSNPGVFSKVEITSSKPEVVMVCDETYYDSTHIKAVGEGKAKITITVDGTKFTQTVSVKAPKVKVVFEVSVGSTIRYQDTIKTDITKTDGNLLTIGQKKSITPNGVAKGSKVTYVSSDKKIATVNSKGTVTAKGIGSCCITVKVDGKVFRYVSISVALKDGIAAVTTGTKYLGTPYSQDRRMQNGYFDCSSFAWRTYKETGKSIGGAESYAPTAAELARYYANHDAVVSYGAVSANELLPGDLIFYSFKGYNGRYNNISHVAVYYGSNYEKLSNGSGVHDTGKMIHSVGRGVVFENYERYNTNSIVMIVRPSDAK